MNSDVTRNAVGELEKLLSQAKRALREVERDVFGDQEGDAGGYVYPRHAMGAQLSDLYAALLVVLEAAEMPKTRTSLIRNWRGFTKTGLRETTDNGEFENCQSPALDYLENLIRGLRMTLSAETSDEGWVLNPLGAMLRDSGGWVN